MTLVQKIKALCEEKDITFAALERRLDFGNGTIRKWDNATPSGDKLAKVADYFGVSVDYLLGRDSKSDHTRLKGVYLNFAKHAQDDGIDPRDIELAIQTIQKLKDRNRQEES